MRTATRCGLLLLLPLFTLLQGCGGASVSEDGAADAPRNPAVAERAGEKSAAESARPQAQDSDSRPASGDSYRARVVDATAPPPPGYQRQPPVRVPAGQVRVERLAAAEKGSLLGDDLAQ